MERIRLTRPRRLPKQAGWNRRLLQSLLAEPMAERDEDGQTIPDGIGTKGRLR